MSGQQLLRGAVILWLVQAGHTLGYAAPSGLPNGQGPRPNGKKPENGGGLGRMLMPSKGVGQNGYGGYGTQRIGYRVAAGGQGGKQLGGNPAVSPHGIGAKSNGYGGQVDPTNGRQFKGYGAATGALGRNGAIPNGYGVQVGPTNGRKTKGNGHGAQAGGYGRQGTKSYGNGAAHNGPATKGNGYGAVSGVSNGNGAKPNGHRGAGSQPGPVPGMKVPQLARNQKTQAYGGNGYNGYGAQTMGGYTGGYGGAGLGLDPQYGNGGLKGPKQGYGAVAGGPDGRGAKTNGYNGARAPNGNGALPNGYGYPSGGATKPAKSGYGNIPNGYGTQGYGATRGGGMRRQSGYGNGAVSGGYGTKPNGHGVRNGATFGGFGGYGRPSSGSKPQTSKGVGAASASEGAKTLGAGYGMNWKSAKAAGAFGGKALKGGALSPEQPSAAPETGVAPQHQAAQGATPVAPAPTSGILVMVTQGKYHKLPSPVPQGKSYKQTPLIPQATPGAEPAIPQDNNPDPAPEPTPEPALLGPTLPVDPQTNPAPDQAAELPQGYVTGNAVPERKGAEADVLFGAGGASEGVAAPEGTKPLRTKAVPETVAATSIGGVTPEETLAVGVPEIAPEEANIRGRPEAESDRPGVKSLPSGQSENRGEAPISKAQGAKPAQPDCGPGASNGQWIQLPRPGAGAYYGTNSKGFGAGAGGPNGYGAKANGYGAGSYSVPELSNGYGAGFGYPYAGNPLQPGNGQTDFLGGGYVNGNSYAGNTGEAGKSKSGYGNGYSAGVQPDYASLGQGVPATNGKSGMSQFEPQSAGLGPNGKLGSAHGGMGSFPFGGLPLGAGTEQTNTKYGIGGLQFGGQPVSTGMNGAGHNGYGRNPYGPGGVGKSSGKYGYGGFPYGGQLFGLGTDGNAAGKYGYGRMPYEPQPAGLSPGVKSNGKYALAGSYQPEPHGQNGKLTGQYAGLSYGSLPLETDSAGKSYVNGEVPTPAVEGEVMPVGAFEMGFINGQVQPEAATLSPTLAPSYLPVESSITPEAVPGAGAEGLPDPAATAGLTLDSTPPPGPEDTVEVHEQPVDLQEHLPHQIHIQHHLKLHFHPQGSKNGKYGLNGFFGNSGYQG